MTTDGRPGSEIGYRRLSPADDVTAITDLLHRAYAPLAAAGLRFIASHQDAATTARRLAKGETFVATDGERIVGVVTLAETTATHGSPFYDRPDVADVGQFAVEPEYQGRGIGSRLLETVEARARAKGVAELALNTAEQALDLIAFYERRGFRFVETAQWRDVNYRSCIHSKRLAPLEGAVACRPAARSGRMPDMHRPPVHASIVDAFTHTAGQGNRAGVVLDAAALDAAAMRAAARSVAASETAFRLTSPPGVDVRLRFFTPVTEIDFCGHATVATFHRLAEAGQLAVPGLYQLETAAGRLEVELEASDFGNRVWIATPRHPWTASPIDAFELMRLMGGTPRMLDPDLPVMRSGSKVFVPIGRRDDLWALAPRWDALAGAGLGHDVQGFFAFTRDAAEPGHVVQGRFFAPALGVREDPATGSANGPLAEYLATHAVIALPEAGGVARARVEQGDAMGRPGRIDLEVRGTPGKIDRVRVGGVAVTVMDGTLFMS